MRRCSRQTKNPGRKNPGRQKIQTSAFFSDRHRLLKVREKGQPIEVVSRITFDTSTQIRVSVTSAHVQKNIGNGT